MAEDPKSIRTNLGDLLQQPIVQIAAQVLGSGKVRLVGGCVRDALVQNLPPPKANANPFTDLDMATSQKPQVVQRALTDAGYKVIPTGLQHGTVTLVHEGEHLEITTLRLDIENHGRHAKVAFTDDWEADAARRDFSFNAISLDMKGQLHDPFGGQEDLKQGCVRFVGNAAQRIDEDHLRLLRYFRFWGRFGRSGPSETLSSVLESKVPLLAKLSAERITKEIFGILVTPKVTETLVMMDQLGIFSALNFPAFRASEFQQLVERETACALISPVRRLAVLAQRHASSTEALIQGLALSNRQKQRLRFMAKSQDIDAQSLIPFVYHHGVEATCDLLFFNPSFSPKRMNALLTQPIPKFPLSGRDLLALGHPIGEPLGRTLKSLEKAWIASGFQISKEELLQAWKQKA